MCVETVDYSVIMNKDMVGPIIPGRGLRQGDPLSPYLFILCAEGLSALIRNAENRGDKVCESVAEHQEYPTFFLLMIVSCSFKRRSVKRIQ